MATRSEIGKTIAQSRKALGRTQKQISKQIRINTTTLSEIENGRFGGSLEIFEHYIDAVGLKLEVKPKQHRLPDWDEIETLFAEDN
jgi:transcriptional regulator with XRE-family HTH domain